MPRADRKLLRTRSVINYSRSFGTLKSKKKNNFIAFLSNEKKKMKNSFSFSAQDCLKSIKIKDIFMNSWRYKRDWGCERDKNEWLELC